MFFPKTLNFNLQQEVLKFSDICMGWSSPKTELEKNFFQLGKSKFRECQLSSIGTI